MHFYSGNPSLYLSEGSIGWDSRTSASGKVPYSLSTASVDSTCHPSDLLVAGHSFWVGVATAFIPQRARLQSEFRSLCLLSRSLYSPPIRPGATVACMENIDVDELFGEESINAAIAATFDTDALFQRIERSHIVGCCQ